MAAMEAILEAPAPARLEHVPHKKLVIMAWSGGPGQDLADLHPRHDGAAMGMETTIFFTFWGLFLLVRNEVHLTGENWMQKMMSMMNRGGTEHLKLGKMNFVGMGPAMMKKLADEHHVAPTSCSRSLAISGCTWCPVR